MELETILYGTICAICMLVSVLSDVNNQEPAILTMTGIMGFWLGNNLIWTSSYIEYMIYFDLVLLLLSTSIAWIISLRWIRIMPLLFLGNVVLDLLFNTGRLSYTPFAWLSNILFLGECFLASHNGWYILFSGFKTRSMDC